MKARKERALGEDEVKKLGIAFKRARYFITCNGTYTGKGTPFTPEGIRPHLVAPIKGGERGSRSKKVIPGQMSLFEEEPLTVQAESITPPKLPASSLAAPDWGAQLYWQAETAKRSRS